MLACKSRPRFGVGRDVFLQSFVATTNSLEKEEVNLKLKRTQFCFVDSSSRQNTFERRGARSPLSCSWTRESVGDGALSEKMERPGN